MSSLVLPLTVPLGDKASETSLVLTSPAPSIYLITWSSPPDNRLTPSFLKAFLAVLDIVEQSVPKSSVLITTSAAPKFYSNGFNIELAKATPDFPRRYWNKLQLRLLTFPIPTVAVMNGHAVSDQATWNSSMDAYL